MRMVAHLAAIEAHVSPQRLRVIQISELEYSNTSLFATPPSCTKFQAAG